MNGPSMQGQSALRGAQAQQHQRGELGGAELPSVVDDILGATAAADAATRRWLALKEQADAAFESGYLPAHVKSIHAARAIAAAGAELGIPPMTAFRVIYFFDGKFALAAQLLHALANRKIPGFRIEFVKSNETGCWVTCWRPGYDEPQKFYFTIKDAGVACLLNKDNWKKYPAAMCRARAVAAAVRAMAPEAILGAYALEEIEPTGVPWDHVMGNAAASTMHEAQQAEGYPKPPKPLTGAAALKADLAGRGAQQPQLSQSPPPAAAAPPAKADRAAPPPGFGDESDTPPAGHVPDDGTPPGFPKQKDQAPPPAPAAAAPPAKDAPAPKSDEPPKDAKPKTQRKSPEESRREAAAIEAEIVAEIDSLTSTAEYSVWDQVVGPKWEKLTPDGKRRCTDLAETRKKELTAAEAKREPGSDG